MAGSHLRTADGLELAARFWCRDTIPPAVVVLVHGFTGSKDDPVVVELAESLHDDGFDVIAFDARGHGTSEGLCTLGDLERLDVAAAVRIARDLSPKVVVVGASMGSIAVLRYAAEDAALAGVVSVSGPGRWELPRTPRTMLAAGITQTPLGRLLARRYLGARLQSRLGAPASAPYTLMAKISVPVAVVHGLRDRFIPPRAARQLFAASRQPHRLALVPGMGHGYVGAAREPIREAVRWALAH